ncbi:hypothetical protein MRX96_056220 [Rhipicephalus microplus]
MAVAAKKPVLVQLDIDSIDGGTSPWFSGMGRMFVAMVTTDPENADLFGQLASEGSMGTLVSYLDTEQAMVSFIALLCYIVLGLTLLSLFVVLPVAAFALRHHTAGVGLVQCLMCGLVLVGCCFVQLICLMSMISTWYAMKDALGEKAPEAYEWTFELLHNYTQLTVMMLKAAKDPDLNLDNSLTATTNSIKWLKGNITAWENSFSAFDSLQRMTTGLLPFLQMGVLGLGMATAVSSALLGCVAWNRRKRNLEQGKKSPIFVATIIVASAVLLLVHLIIALPMIARWLPLCVMTNTYLCAPYRDSSYVVLDDAIARLWPPSSRPEPFCRLVPSKLTVNCSTKGKAPIKSLPTCPSKATKKNTLEVPGEDAVVEVQVLRPPQTKAAAAPAAKVKVNGDCFYPYKIIDTDMTAACPLYSDNLVAHWMAMLVSVIFGVLAAMAAGALAVVYLAVGEKKPTKKKIKKIRRRKRVRKAAATSQASQARPRDAAADMLAPTTTAFFPPPMSTILPAPIFLPPPMIPTMPPFPTPPALLPPPPSEPQPLPQIMSSCSGENQQSAVAYTNVNVYGGGSAGGYASWPYAQSALPAVYPTRAAISAQPGRTTLAPQPARSCVVSQTSVTRLTGGSSPAAPSAAASRRVFQGVRSATQPVVTER